MKTDFSDEIRALLSGNYQVVKSAAHDSDLTEKKTLSEIHKEVTSVLPSRWIEESDVYEALLDIGFKSFLYTTEAETDEETEMESPSKSKMAYFMERIS